MPAQTFYPADIHHQNYEKKHPREYQLYHKGSGREDFILKYWGYQPKKLTNLQKSVLYEDGTEPPFENEYWNNKQEGIYIDITTGDPLFCSLHKFESGTGWPSFYQPIDKERIVQMQDFSYDQHRIEIRSSEGDIHLGHLFPDGPPPTGLRYCINSAALHFVPIENMAKEGYIESIYLFR